MRKVLVFIVSTIIFVTIVLSGCNNTTTTTSTNPVTSPGVATPNTSSLVVACNSEPDILDTAASKVFFNSYPLLCNIFEQNSVPDMSGNWKGLIAESEELSQDGKILTFHIRKGVKFHNGDPMTAKDVAWSIQRRIDFDPMWPLVFLRGLDHFEAVDDYTVKFYMKEMDWQTIMSLRVFQYTADKAYWEKVGEDAFCANPVGTGPYKFVKWVKGQYLDLEANENYWGGKPQISKIRIMFAPEDTTRVAMLKTGEADMIMDTPWGNVAELENAGFNTVKLKVTPLLIMRIQCLNASAPWANVKVRQAMAYALDRKSLINNVMGGIPAYFPYQAPGDPGYDPNLKAYEYNIAKAKELLKEAGYEKGFDMPLFYRSAESIPGIRDITDYVVTALKAININCVDIKGMEEVALNPLKVQWHDTKETGGAIIEGIGIAPSVNPTGMFQMVFYSGAPQSCYSNPDVDALILASCKEIDDTKRAELIQKTVAILNEELPVIPILGNNTVYAVKKDVNYQLLVKDDIRMLWLKNITMR
jgi:peptide/nickel transport system substrate-binding protein